MQVTFKTIDGLPLVEPGDKLPELFVSALNAQGDQFQDGDILVIAQKVVSKSENRYLALNDIQASAEAIALAKEVQKDARYVQAVLDESRSVIRKKPGVLIVEHRLGFIHANAGIDQSNIEHHENSERLLLLPENPDLSAKTIQNAIRFIENVEIAVIVNDSMGRAWRNGTVGLAIGLAGIAPIDDKAGGYDIFGRKLNVTAAAIADEIAAGASLLMGQSNEQTPAVIVRGYPGVQQAGREADISPLLRGKEMDLFR